MKKKFEVQIYYSGFCTYEVEADNKEDALKKARKNPLNKKEILSNLDNWKEADTIKEILNEKQK